MSWHGWRQEKAHEMRPAPMSRGEMFEAYERLEGQIERITNYELPNAELRGGYRHREKVLRKLDRLDADLTHLHQQLFPPVIGSIYEAPEPNPLACAYCGEYVFRDRREKFDAGSVCPRCDPTSPGVSPTDPNYQPRDRR